MTSAIRLEPSVVVLPERIALYHGAWSRIRIGHSLYDMHGRSARKPAGFPWTDAHMDAELLHNGEHEDVVDGRVFWTCGGTPLWLAFFWWDRSADGRGASNSGFYVTGFSHKEPGAAFEYACQAFPQIVARQAVPLRLVV